MNYKKVISDFEKNFDLKKVRKEKEVFGSGIGIVYSVFVRKFGPLNMDLTVVEAGKFGKEFYRTKGHIHRQKNTPEFYVLLEGEGILVLKKGKIPKKIKMKKGEINLVESGWAHRIVNLGRKKLKVLTSYSSGSKPNYKVRF